MNIMDWETMPADMKLAMLIHWIDTISDRAEELYRTEVMSSRSLVDAFATLADAKQIFVDVLTEMRT